MRAGRYPAWILFSAAIILVISSGSLYAQVGNGPGTSSGEILDIGIGGRASALGGAYTAFSDDATACFWNPSGLTELSSIEVQFGYSSWYQDISLNYLASVIPVSSRVSAGVGITYVDFGDFQGYDQDDRPTGSFSGHNAVFSISLACRAGGGLSLGITGKGISEKLGESSASGFALDAGTKLNSGILSFGLALKNLGGGLKYEYESAPFPAKLVAGIGLSTFDHRLQFAADINLPRNGQVSLHQGVEFLYMSTIYLRGGYVHDFGHMEGWENDGFAYGFGLVILSGSLNYSYIPDNNLGAVHRIDIALRLNN